MWWDGVEPRNTPNPCSGQDSGTASPRAKGVKPCWDPPTKQSCQPCAALDLCQPWNRHIWGWLLTALGFKHPGTVTAKICHQHRVCGTSGAQECETGTGDSPRALFPLTAAVILGAWRNGECVCRGQLDPGKKEMCFSLRKIQQHCSLIGKRPGFVFLVVIFFLSWRSSDTLQHFKVFPENEEQPQPCQEQLVSHHG